MPVPAAPNIEIVINHPNKGQLDYELYGNSTGSLYYIEPSKDGNNSFYHSSFNDVYTLFEGTVSNIFNSDFDKKYIKLKNSYYNQFEKLKTHFTKNDVMDIGTSIDNSLTAILQINPDLISLELTEENSAFYSFTKGNYKVFLQHFLSKIEEEDDEAILSIFQDNVKHPSYAGTLKRTIEELQKLVSDNFMVP